MQYRFAVWFGIVNLCVERKMTITLTREEAQQVLDAMEYHVAQTRPIARTQETIETLRTKLTQPEREWQGLTDEEIDQVAESFGYGYIDVARAIESKLKEKNR
jgi:hypothetical protein